jgi:chromosome partitioning protein
MDAVAGAEVVVHVQRPTAHVVVFGNEKGGSGKTTSATHVAIALAGLGYRVAALDLDSRQKSFARYIENRAAFAARTGATLATPVMEVVPRAQSISLDEAAREETARFEEALARARATADIVIIDTQGGDTTLTRLGHAAADTLVTPMNDSFLDFDLLANLDPETYAVKGPSVYSEFVWECRKRRLAQRLPPLDWVVMRNRMNPREARNTRRLNEALTALASRIGFRLSSGFSERVIFRELFPLGLTLFDLPQPSVRIPLAMSHVAARQEIRALVGALRLPKPPGAKQPAVRQA